MFRIQKLLMTDYLDFEETILVESPFAQVTETGKGIRQVQIGLTATKLIIAGDVFNKKSSTDLSNIYYCKNDPEIESMELISVIPLHFLYLKVFRRGNRQLLKVNVAAIKIMLFEFGGHISRNIHWNIWRNRLMMLRMNQLSNSSGQITTSSVDTLAEPKLIYVEINKQNSDISQKPKTNTVVNEKTKLCSFDLLGNYGGTLSSKFSSSCNSESTFLKEQQKKVLRDAAERFLQTQSEVAVSQLSGMMECNGQCSDFLFKSVSLNNMNFCSQNEI